eukprot:TRINITY_DN3784_c0_g1_i1.p1 TRINITY_DN3784_c0_g1~~TRINITY_DN3784_c0_g1_i1.p1  ORF type:complete len:606 (-),score=132.51 TRINITY_DN3784_c0_g1_i1:389-2206(-)
MCIRDSHALRLYMAAMGWGRVAIAAVLGVVTYTTYAACDLWLARWVQEDYESGTSASEAQVYGFVYAAGCFAQLGMVLLTSGYNGHLSVRASRSMHDDCLWSVLHAPMSWFEATPSGRILSRFSGDLSIVDQHLIMYYDDSFHFGILLLALNAVILYVIPMLAPLVCGGMALFGFAVAAVDRSNREVKRCMNHALGPLLTMFNDTWRGLDVIQMHSSESHVALRFAAAVDEYSRFSYASTRITNWGRLVSNLISFVVSITAASFVMAQRHSHEPTRVALALTNSFLLPYFFSLATYLLSATFTGLTSLERLLQLQAIPQEPPWYMPGDRPDPDPHLHPSPHTPAPCDDWPATGAIVFRDVDLKYRPDLPLSIKGASFVISDGEKVGVVGATGAGKSSLLTLLFRIVERSAGLITLDGVDIAQVGLHRLRRGMCVIPQEPLLLAGTVRHNLDPFNAHQDQLLTQVVQRVGLRAGTKQVLEEEAAGMSAGEAQLLSLARALLRRDQVKLIVMDEATASVDTLTDSRLQAALRSYFQHHTFLTIAHRLNTVIDHKILVMDDGRVAEFGSAAELLGIQGGHFSRMVEAMGDEGAEIRKRLPPCPSAGQI